MSVITIYRAATRRAHMNFWLTLGLDAMLPTLSAELGVTVSRSGQA